MPDMKTTLRVSMLLNLGLLTALIFLWANPRREAPVPPPAVPKVEAPPPTVAVSTPPIVRTVVETKPFHWDQLVSTNDYRVFVANLRRIGCPEPTVEDIVRGDAERFYFAKRTEMNVDGTKPGPWSAQAQMEMVAFLLGQTPETVVAATPAPPVRSPKEMPLSMPLVLQNVDLKALGLDDEQTQMVANVRQDFLQQTGGMNQDTNSPAYRQRWQEAQLSADGMLQAMLGNDIYQRYQVLAFQTSLVNQEQTRN